MARKYQNFISGTLSVAHSSTETLMQSPGLASVMSISGNDYITIVLNPEGDETYSSGPEIVHLVSHAAGSTSAEIVRGQQGTSAKAHALNTPWIAPTTADDWLRVDAMQTQMSAIQADGWVTSNRIAPSAVDRHKIAQSAVAANSGITIVDGQLSAVVDGLTIEHSPNGMRVRDLSINTQHLTNLAVTQGKIASGAVTSDKIADRAVTQAKLGTDVISPGVVWMTAAPNPPDGWLLCDGQAVSRSTYSDLFAVIGTLYGPGDGINTFNLPNYKGRVPVHLDSDQTEFDTLNKRGGQKQVGLTASNLPSHTHPFSATTSNQSANHVHHINAISMDPEGTQPSQFGLGVLSVAANTHYETLGVSNNHTHSVSGVTGATGGGATHLNLQPYVVVNFIIKT